MIEINFFDKITNFEHIIQYYGYFNHEVSIFIFHVIIMCASFASVISIDVNDAEPPLMKFFINYIFL